MPRILLIDDDVELCTMLKNYLETDSLQLDSVYNGKDALDRLLPPDAAHYDLLLLDVMLPGKNGFEVLETIRENKLDVPVLMLTARGSSTDKISGLRGGADDYVCKPCDPCELAERIAAILRRTGTRHGQVEPGNVLCVGDVELDREARVVRVAGSAASLTDVEFRLLDLLLKNAGVVVSTESLFFDVLGREYVLGDRSLSTHASRLRQKLGPHPDGSIRIKAPRGKGLVYIPSCTQVGG